MIPEGWKKSELGQACEFQRGFDLPSGKRTPGTVPVISSSGISGYHDVPMAYPPGLVTGRYGTIGTLYFVEEPFWPLNTALWVKNLHGNDARFFYHLLSRFDFKKFSDKTGVPGVNRNDLHAVQILVPERLDEQRRIAEILSTWDRAIEATEKLIANSQARKKALMQQLLMGKKRLPGFTGEWQKVRLHSLLKEEAERNRESKVTRVLSVTNHSGIILPEEQFYKRVASDDVTNYKIVRKGQFAYNPSRLNVGSFARLDGYDLGVLSPMYVVFSVDCSQLNSDFFYAWMTTDQARQRVLSSVQGSVRDSVGFDALCSFPFWLPPLAEQAAIANVLLHSDKQAEHLRSSLAKLKAEKSALMQQLLTGKRRVKLPSPQEEAA